MSPPPADDDAPRTGEPNDRQKVLGVGLLFGMMYFAQGIGEPTEGLISQPVKSLLATWGHSTAEIAAFAAVLALPWSFKPFYGLLTDFCPIFGARRRSYLLLVTALTAASLLAVYAYPPPAGHTAALLWLLLVPTVGVAFSDVVVDALMVETGRPRGLTGRLQSVQWAAMYLAAIVTGRLGGWLSQTSRQELGFLICALAAAASFAVALLWVREPAVGPAAVPLRRAGRTLWNTARSPGVWGAAAFLFLWNFNPFSSAVLYGYMTQELRLSDQFYGDTNSLFAVAAVVACALYGLYCRRLPFLWLIHLSILFGVLSTVAYWRLEGRTSAVWITLAVGFAYMTATLVQLDLAARVCLPESAGTTFAVLMALSNFSVSLSMALGGYWYDRWQAEWDSRTAFHLLVTVGAAFTAGCWLLVPWLARAHGKRAA